MTDMVEVVATVLAKLDDCYPWILDDGHLMRGRKDYYFERAVAAIDAINIAKIHEHHRTWQEDH